MSYLDDDPAYLGLVAACKSRTEAIGPAMPADRLNWIVLIEMNSGIDAKRVVWPVASASGLFSAARQLLAPLLLRQ